MEATYVCQRHGTGTSHATPAPLPVRLRRRTFWRSLFFKFLLRADPEIATVGQRDLWLGPSPQSARNRHLQAMVTQSGHGRRNDLHATNSGLDGNSLLAVLSIHLAQVIRLDPSWNDTWEYQPARKVFNWSILKFFDTYQPFSDAEPHTKGTRGEQTRGTSYTCADLGRVKSNFKTKQRKDNCIRSHPMVFNKKLQCLLDRYLESLNLRNKTKIPGPRRPPNSSRP